jgi:hypothetical protein
MKNKAHEGAGPEPKRSPVKRGTPKRVLASMG